MATATGSAASDTSSPPIGAFDERLREEAATAGRAALDAALQRFTAEQRDAFWNAIGLYYSTRRHPGANEAAATPAI